MVGVILAAGNGSRFIEEYGAEICKALVKIQNRHVIEYSLENLFLLQVERIYIVVGKYRDEIRAVVGDRYKNIPVAYVIQEKPVGLINAISRALPYFSDDFAVQLGDEIFLDCDIPRLKKMLTAPDYDFLCCITRESDAEKIKANYSVVLDKDFNMLSCEEKPKTVVNQYKGTGFCIFSRECAAELRDAYHEQENSPCDLCDYMNDLLRRGKVGKCFLIADKEVNINTVSDFNYAKAVSKYE